jgi:hypothetical protein
MTIRRYVRLAQLVRISPQWWQRVALVILGLYVLFYLARAVELLNFPVDLDQGEGYDSWSGWLIRQGQWPYTDNASFPYYSSNYPPVWSAMVGAAMVITGPQLNAGRAISVLAALGSAALIVAAVYRLAWLMAGEQLALKAGLLAGACFLSSPYVFHTTPLARVNSLALFLSLIGLSLCEQPSRVRLIAAGAALLAALYTTQTTADAMVTAVVFVSLLDLRRGLIFGGSMFLLALVAFFGLEAATHEAFSLNVFAGNVNPFDFGQLAGYVVNFVQLHAVVWTCALVLAARWWQQRKLSPWLLYLVASQVAALTSGKIGAGESYFLGLIAASCVLFGCLVAQVWHKPAILFQLQPSQRVVQSGSALGFLLMVQAVIYLHGPFAQLPPVFMDRGFQGLALGTPLDAAQRASALAITGAVANHSGLVLAEDSGFVLAAGKPVIGNSSHLRNLYDSGLVDPSNLVRQVRRREFDLIILHAQRYPAPVLQAIGTSYYVEQSFMLGSAEYILFIPGGE